MALKRDSIGRIKRKCKPRRCPMKIFRKDEFLSRYRVSKKVIRELVNKYKQHSTVKGKKNGGGLSYSSRFCLALRYFATGAIQKTCGDTQGVSDALVSRAVKDVSDYFYKNASEYIHFPTSVEEQVDKACEFFKHKDQGTPKIIGCVDGTHVPIVRPKVNESCYVNRKSYHSINTTIYCDFKRRITHVDPRWPGSVNDAYALQASTIGDMCRLSQDGKGPLSNFVLLADSGYALSRNVFIPYKKPTTDKQRAFNKWHRKNRVRVEQTIGILKQRWRCMDSSAGYMYHTPQRAARIIVACCCLHNVAEDHGLRITTHPCDPFVPTRKRLDQPRQRTQALAKAAVKKVRDDYADKYF